MRGVAVAFEFKESEFSMGNWASWGGWMVGVLYGQTGNGHLHGIGVTNNTSTNHTCVDGKARMVWSSGKPLIFESLSWGS